MIRVLIIIATIVVFSNTAIAGEDAAGKKCIFKSVQHAAANGINFLEAHTERTKKPVVMNHLRFGEDTFSKTVYLTLEVAKQKMTLVYLCAPDKPMGPVLIKVK